MYICISKSPPLQCFPAPGMAPARAIRMQSYSGRPEAKRCDFGERATSAPAELGGEGHNVSRNRARTRVLLQARMLHVYGSGTCGAF